jgi:hypothetical protein
VSFDIGILFNAVPEQLQQRMAQRWARFSFPARLVLPSNWREGPWLAETPIADDHPAAPGLWQGEDAMRIEISASGREHIDADVAELRSGFTHAGRISVSGAAGMTAFIVASTLAEVLDGVVWDPQGVLADVVDLTRFRDHPEQLSLEERGYFMGDALAAVAEQFWNNDSAGYQKTMAQFAQAAKPAGWLARLRARLAPGTSSATQGGLRINLASVRRRRGIKASGPQ